MDENMNASQTTQVEPRTATWLITGASTGLGRALAEAALGAGENVVGTARRISRFDDLTRRFPENFMGIEHDVRDTAVAAAVIESAMERFGGIDVLVNNAGVGQVGAAEEVSDEQLRDMLAQHLFGPAAYVRAVLPFMRAARSGVIVQMSSQGGRMSFPGVGSYSAGKFALEGWSEALAGEVKPFGIDVVIIEPSRFRTGFNAADVLVSVPSHSAYDGIVAKVRNEMAGADGLQEGDPVRAASVIREVVACDEKPLRLPLGAEAVRNLTYSYARAADEVRREAERAASADFPDAPANIRAFEL